MNKPLSLEDQTSPKALTMREGCSERQVSDFTVGAKIHSCSKQKLCIQPFPSLKLFKGNLKSIKHQYVSIKLYGGIFLNIRNFLHVYVQAYACMFTCVWVTCMCARVSVHV